MLGLRDEHKPAGITVEGEAYFESLKAKYDGRLKSLATWPPTKPYYGLRTMSVRLDVLHEAKRLGCTLYPVIGEHDEEGRLVKVWPGRTKALRGFIERQREWLAKRGYIYIWEVP